MRQIFAFVALYCFWHGLVFAEIKMQVLDAAGNPVQNAVVSLPLTEQTELSKDLTMAVMDQVDKQFLPHVLLVKAGQPVIFPNSDQVRHHVYSFSKPNDFEIRLYSGDQTAPLHFDHPGVVVLGCNIHDQMVGYLYVQGNEIAKVTDAQGYVEFDQVHIDALDQTQSVSIWHSRLSSNKTERVSQILTEKNTQNIWMLKVDLLPEVKKTSRKFKPRYL